MAKYRVVIKVTDTHFIKYRNVTNLVRMVAYLDKQHPGWRWFNVYDNETRQQITSYTRHNRPK